MYVLVKHIGMTDVIQAGCIVVTAVRFGSCFSVTVHPVCLLTSTVLHIGAFSFTNNGAEIEGCVFTECTRNYLYCFSHCPSKCASSGVFLSLTGTVSENKFICTQLYV